MNRINCHFTLKYNNEDYNSKKISIIEKLTKFPVKHIEVTGDSEKTPILSCGTNTFTSANTIIRMFGTLPTASSLYGATDFRKAMVDKWLDFEMNELEVPIGVLTFPSFKKIRENRVVSKESKKDLKNKLMIIEEELKHHKYLIDDELSFADISLVCDLWNVFKMILTEKERNELPVLTKYFSNCLTITEIHDVLGDITYYATQNELNKKKKKQDIEVTRKEKDVKIENRKIDIKRNYPEYDINAINKNVAILSTNLSYKYTRKRVYIQDIYNINDSNMNNNEIKVCGWIETIRESEDKNMVEVDINDGSYYDCLTLTINKDNISEDLKIRKNYTIEVKGIISKKLEGNVKMNVNEIVSLSQNNGDLLIDKDDISAIQSIYHLRPRNKIYGNIMKVRNSCSFATHLFYNQHGFIYINPPIITSNKPVVCDSVFNVTTMFNDKTKQMKYTKDGKIDYTEDFFKREVTLCQSNELSIEPFCLSLGDVYSFNPVFNTNTEEEEELSERWYVTTEMSFVEMEDLMDICEDYIKYCLCYVIEKNKNELKNVFTKAEEIESKIDTLNKIVLNPFKRVEYKEGETVKEGEKGVFEYHKPVDKSKFYIKTGIDNKYSYSFDVTLPEIGIIGEGCVKEDRIEVLEEKMKECGCDENTMRWYLDLRKYGNTNHGGFTVYFDKLVKYIVGMKSIKDIVPYPRWKDNLSY